MNKEALFVTMALQAWETHVNRTEKLIQSLPEEQLLSEIAPGKNTGAYLVGHLIAIHDAMNTLLGTGERSYAPLDAAFVQNPDKSGLETPGIKELKQYWQNVHVALSVAFKKMQPGEWFEKHNAISAEDFATQPTRNKLNVLINRTNHLAYHLGQLQLLK